MGKKSISKKVAISKKAALSKKCNGRPSQDKFEVDTLGDNLYPSPLKFPASFSTYSKKRVLYNNLTELSGKVECDKILSFELATSHPMIHFDSSKINVGIVTCGGLCPGLNDVIRSIVYNCLDGYKVKTVYGFKHGYQGLVEPHCHGALSLDSKAVDNIHEQGGTILGSSRGSQSIIDMVDTLVKFNISALFVIGGDGTQTGALEIGKEVKRRKLDIAIVGIPKTIDNDISFVHKTFGFDTAVEEARKAIDAAHVEAKGAMNGIGMVKLMGRHSGFIATHATLASGNVNICLIPEEPLDLEKLGERVARRLSTKDHLVIVIAEGVGQDILAANKDVGTDASGNAKLQDIGPFIKEFVGNYLKKMEIDHTIKYIDPSYMIRSTAANAIDSSFCLRLANYATHAAMAGRTNCIVGYWNQNFTLVPTTLSLNKRKYVDIDSALWRSIVEITFQ